MAELLEAELVETEELLETELAFDSIVMGDAGVCTKPHIPSEALYFSGSQAYRFQYGAFNWLIEACGESITTKAISDAYGMFDSSHLKDIPFDINILTTSAVQCDNIFKGTYIKTPPYIKGKVRGLNSCFSDCIYLTEIPEDWADYIDWGYANSYPYLSLAQIFYSCYSLRKIPKSLMSKLWGVQTSTSYVPYYNMCNNCYVLDELVDVPIHQATLTSQAFSNTVNACCRLKDFTFATQEDGTPYIAKWKSQTISIKNLVGYGSKDSLFTSVGSNRFTEDTKVFDDESYQRLKNHPDYWTIDAAYSRYTHDSAVRTINSLPDTSAYGTNTLSFNGALGSATDEGPVSALSDAEIAIATQKGWTVSIS